MITKLQQKAIYRTFGRSADGAASYLQFRRRFRKSFDGCLIGKWLGMTLGIETDGYTHT
jgi:hypothetical protein